MPNRAWSALLAWFFAAGLAIADELPTNELVTIYNQAVDLFNAGKDAEAVPLLKQVIKEAPDYAPAYSVYGSALMGVPDYAEAICMLKKATELQPNWSNWYNLGVCYQNIGDLPLQIEAWKKALALDPQKSAEVNLANSLKFTEAQMGDPAVYQACREGADYLPLLEEKGFYRWPQESIPIKVHIQDGTGLKNYSAELTEALKQAFSDWTQGSEGLIKFEFVQDPKQAQVHCSWTDNVKELPYKTEAGHATPRLDGHHIKSAKLILSTTSPLTGRAETKGEVYHTALHEVGHVLGLDHSPNLNDVMYFVSKEGGQLSSRDKRTLVALYSLSKERLTAKKLNTSALVQAGGDGPATQALQLANEAGDDLANDNYAAAEEKLKKALQLQPGNDLAITNLSVAYHNEMVDLINKKENAKAAQVAKRAISFGRQAKKPEELKWLLQQYLRILKEIGNTQEANDIKSELAKLE